MLDFTKLETEACGCSEIKGLEHNTALQDELKKAPEIDDTQLEELASMYATSPATVGLANYLMTAKKCKRKCIAPVLFEHCPGWPWWKWVPIGVCIKFPW